MAVARRLATYIMALVGLLAVLYAAAGLLGIAVATQVLHSSTLVGADDLRSRTSLYLAALLVGLPLWLGGWLASERRTDRAPEERDSRERRLFLAAVFGVTSITALFQLHALLSVLLTLPGPADARPSTLDGIRGGVGLLIYGGAWLAYARMSWREGHLQAEDGAHDLAIYLLAGCALVFLCIGLYQGVQEVTGDLLTLGSSTMLNPSGSNMWPIWGSIAAWLAAAGPIWLAVWRYDLRRGGRRGLRVAYLYLVLLAAMAAALFGGTDGLYEVLRRLLGYVADWSFLRDVAPPLLLGGVLWLYHWTVMRRQAAVDPGATTRPAGGIAWPRRAFVMVLALVGLIMGVSAVVSLLWLGLDAMLATGDALSGGAWWRDRASLSLAGGAVGLATWLGAWSLMQRAATADAAGERAAPERRGLLGLATAAGGLCAAGFAIAVLWQLLRAVLGESLDAAALGSLLKDLVTVGVAGVVAAYHGLILRADLRQAGAHAGRLRLIALVAPGTEALLAELRRATGQHIEVTGYLDPADAPPPGVLVPFDALLAQVTAPVHGSFSRGVIVLHPDGGRLYRYVRWNAWQVPTITAGPRPAPEIAGPVVNKG